MYFWQFYHVSDRQYFFLPWDIGSGEMGFSDALLRVKAMSMYEDLWGHGEASEKAAPGLRDPRNEDWAPVMEWVGEAEMGSRGMGWSVAAS